MGGGSASSGKSSSSSTKTTTYGNTTTSNPYITSTTNNKGTTTDWKDGTALQSVNNFVNDNINGLLQEYINPSIDSATNQAKLNQFNNAQQQNLQNNIINPLAKNNMIRSSQATNLYNNLSNQSADYVNSLIANSQDTTANTINNLMNYVLQGWNVINGNQALSLNSSQGNATSNVNTTGKSNSVSYST